MRILNGKQLSALTVVGIVLAVAASALGGAYTWTYTAGDANWTDGLWTPAGWPSLPGDTATIGGALGANQTIYMTEANAYLSQLTFNGTDPNWGFSLSNPIGGPGAAITFDDGTSRLTYARLTATNAGGSVNMYQINVPIILNDNLLFSATTNNTAKVSITGSIFDGSGPRAITVGGTVAGTYLYLDGNNSYSGGTRQTTGYLSARAAGALGTGPVTLYGGTLIVSDANVLNRVSSVTQWGGSIQPVATGVGGTVTTFGGEMRLNQPYTPSQIDYGTNLVVNKPYTIFTVIGGTDANYVRARTIGNLTVNNTSVISSSASSDAGASLSVTGLITVTGKAAFDEYNSGVSMYFAGQVTGSGTIVRYNTGRTLTLYNANNNFSGGIISLSGSVQGTVGGAFGTGPIYLRGGSFTPGQYSGGAADQTFTNDVIVEALGAMSLNRSGTTFLYTMGGLTLVGNTTFNFQGGTGGHNAAYTGTVTLGGLDGFNTNNSNAYFYNSVVGTGGLSVNRSATNGTYYFLGAGNSFTGGLNVNSGGVQLKAPSAAGAGPVAVYGSVTSTYVGVIEANTNAFINAPSVSLYFNGSAASLRGIEYDAILGTTVYMREGNMSLLAADSNRMGGTVVADSLFRQSTLLVGRLGAAATNKLVDVDALTFNADRYLTINANNGYVARVLGATNLAGGIAGADVQGTAWLAGDVTGAGKLMKTGAGMLVVGGGAQSWNGGMQINAGAVRLVTPDANLGGGDTVLSGSATLATLGLWNDGAPGTETSVGLGRIVVASGGQNYLDSNSTTANITYVLPNDLVLQSGSLLHINNVKTNSIRVAGTTSVSGRAQIDSNGVGAVTLGPIAGDSGSYLLLTGRGATYSVNLVSAVDANFVGSLGVGGVAYNAAGIAAGGTVSLRKEGTLQSIAGLDVYKGGTFLVDDSVDGNIAAWNVANRLNDNLQVTMRGGEFRLAAPDGNLASETVGTLKLASGASTVSSIRVAAANNANTSAFLTFNDLSRDAGSTVMFSTNTNNILASVQDKITLTTNPTLTGNLIGGWAFTSNNNWASYDANAGVNSVVALAKYNAQNIDGNWSTTELGLSLGNVAPGASLPLTDNRTINSLRLGAYTLDANNYQLKVVTGGIMSTSNSAVITASGTGSITADSTVSSELLFVSSSYNMLVSAPIVNDGGNAIAVVSSLPGTLFLTNPSNTFSGGLVVNQGTVEANYLTSTNGNVTLAGGKLTIRKDASATLAGLVLKDNYSTLDVRPLVASTNQAVTFTSLTAGDLTGLTVTGANGHDVNISGATTLQGTAVFSINSANSDLTLAGNVTGAGQFEKLGTAGNLVLSNAYNDWTGGFTLTEGNMIATAQGALGKGAGLVRGGVLDVREANALMPSANLTVNAGGTVLFAKAPQVQYTGAVKLAGGTLNLRADTNTSWESNVVLLDNTLDAAGASTINVNALSSSSNMMHTIRTLTMGTQQLVVSGANGHDLTVAGTTMLSGGGAVVNVTTAGTDLWLNGPITGPGSLAKLGAGTLYLNSTDTSGWTGGLTSWGTVIANAQDSNALGAGPLTLGSGTVQLLTDKAGTVAMGNNVTVQANTSLQLGRWTPATVRDSNLITFQFGNLTIGNYQTLAVYGTKNTDKGYTLEFTGTTTLTGPAVFYTDGNVRGVVLSGNVTGSGWILKQGTVNGSGQNINSPMFLTGTNNNFTGGVVANGSVIYGCAAGAFGTGRVSANGGLAVIEANAPNALINNTDIIAYAGGTVNVRYDTLSASSVTTVCNGTVALYASQSAEPNFILTTGSLYLYNPTATDFNINVSVVDVDASIYSAQSPSSTAAVTHTIHNLTMGEGRVLYTRNVGQSSTYGLIVDGTTTLTKGDTWMIPSSYTALYLAGMVTGSGTLGGAGSADVYLDGSNNNYSGGTFVKSAGLHSRNWGALSNGPVSVNPGATLYLEANGAAYNNAITLEREAVLSVTKQYAMVGATSLTLNGTTLSLNLPQDYSGGVILNTDSSLTVTNLNDSNLIAGNALGTGQVTMTSSTLTLLSNVDYVWGNDVAMDDGSIISARRVSGSGTTNSNRLHTLGALVASNLTLDPTNIVTANGHRVAFSGLDLTGGLTISGLDLSFNRDPAKRVSILGATNLTVSADANLYIGGTADMLTDTVVDANFHLSIVNNNQVFVTGTAIHNAGNVSGPGLAASGRTNIAAGATLGVTRIRQQQVDVSGKLVLNGGSGPATSIVNALNIAGVTDAWTGLVDIRQGYLVLPSATASDVGNQVKQASNFAAFGSWDGTGGITSSSAAGDQLYGVGYADNAIAKKSEFGEANGLAYTGVLVRYTYVGDTNLDGITDLDKDYYNWSFGYLNAGNNTWYYGDFNYDGQVDLDKDYYIWSYGYLNQGSPLVGGAESAVDTSPSSAPVPEPATVGLLGLGLLGLLRRRSRKA